MIPFNSLEQAIAYGEQHKAAEFCCVVVWKEFRRPIRFRYHVNMERRSAATIPVYLADAEN